MDEAVFSLGSSPESQTGEESLEPADLAVRYSSWLTQKQTDWPRARRSNSFALKAVGISTFGH